MTATAALPFDSRFQPPLGTFIKFFKAWFPETILQNNRACYVCGAEAAAAGCLEHAIRVARERNIKVRRLPVYACLQVDSLGSFACALGLGVVGGRHAHGSAGKERRRQTTDVVSLTVRSSPSAVAMPPFRSLTTSDRFAASEWCGECRFFRCGTSRQDDEPRDCRGANLSRVVWVTRHSSLLVCTRICFVYAPLGVVVLEASHGGGDTGSPGEKFVVGSGVKRQYVRLFSAWRVCRKALSGVATKGTGTNDVNANTRLQREDA